MQATISGPSPQINEAVDHHKMESSYPENYFPMLQAYFIMYRKEKWDGPDVMTFILSDEADAIHKIRK